MVFFGNFCLSFIVGYHRWVLWSLCLCRGQWIWAFLLGLPDCSSRTPALWHQYSRPVHGHSIPRDDRGSSPALCPPSHHQRAEHSAPFNSRIPEHFVCYFGSSSLSLSLFHNSPLFRARFKKLQMTCKIAATRLWLLLGLYIYFFYAGNDEASRCLYQQRGWCECVISDYVCSNDFFSFSVGWPCL